MASLREESAEEDLRQSVATAGRVLYREGLADYLGHCSSRLPGADWMVIKPKFSPRTRGLGSLGPEDMLVLDLEGNLLEGSEPPPAEYWIHTEIYRTRPDVTAVVHTHQPFSTLLGVIGAPLLPVLHVPSVLTNGGDVATWSSPLLVTSRALGQELATALGARNLCHLQGHGIVTVASDLRVATVAAIAFEQLAQANLTILHSGRHPRLITPNELEQLRASFGTVDGRWAYYLQRLEEP